MSFNRTKYEYFFPSKVFCCACLGEIIKKCYDHGIYSFTDIIDKIVRHNFIDDDKNKIFAVKCGEQCKDCIFTCEKHLSIILIAKKKFSYTDIPSETNITVTYCCSKEETYCVSCIKHYLKLRYTYFYFCQFWFKIFFQKITI